MNHVSFLYYGNIWEKTIGCHVLNSSAACKAWVYDEDYLNCIGRSRISLHSSSHHLQCLQKHCRTNSYSHLQYCMFESVKQRKDKVYH